MKNFLKNNWGRVILFIILSVICVLSFSKGKYLLGNDNYSPELNPGLTIERSIESPAWRSYRGLGFGSESEQADVFRSIFFGITEKFLPQDSLGQIFGLLCLFVGSWFMGELTGLIVKDFFKKKYSQLGLLLGGVIYVSTLWTPWVFSFHMSPFISQFGFLPLLLFSIYNYLRNPSNKKLFLVFISGILFASSCVIATIFFVDIVIITAFTLYFACIFNKKNKERIKNGVTVLGVFLITQLFWILPFVAYTINNTQGLFDSYVNRSITANTIDLEREMMDASNSSRFYTRLLNTDADKGGTKLFPLSDNYNSYNFYKVFSYLPIFFSFVGFVFLILKKKWKPLIFWILALGSWFLIKNGNAPLGEIYIWLQENISIFKQVFRWVSSKMGNVYLISITICSVYGVIMFLDFLTSFFQKKNVKKLLFGILTILLVIIQLFYGEFLFTKNLYPERSLAEDFPNEYFELKEYLAESDLETSRIYYAPPSNNGYFREYDWGFVGSVFLNYVIPNPLMDLSLAIGSAVGEKAMYELEDAYLSQDADSFKAYLGRYDVEYVLVDRNLTDTVYGYDIDWDLTDNILSSFKKEWESGDLELYSFEQDPIEDILISDFNISNPSRENNYLLGGFENVKYSNQIEQDSLPTFVKIEEERVKIYPAIPNIQGEEVNLKYKEFELGGDYIVIDKYILSMEELGQGIAIDTAYGNISKIFSSNSDSLNEQDLITGYRNAIAGDCSTGDFVKSVNSQSEELASGVKLTGTDGLPCLSQPISVKEESIVKVNLDWETDGQSIAGICVYSYGEEKCINKDKYLYAKDFVGSAEFVLERTISPDEYVDIFLYSLNPMDGNAEIIYRDISISASPISKELSLENSGYFMYSPTTSGIPIVKGLGYEYSEGDFTWQSNIEKGSQYEISNSNGMVQSVEDGIVTQTNGVLETNPLEKYIWYIAGENISNVPSTLCLYYVGDDKCWEPEILLDRTETNILKTFTASSQDPLLEMSYMSVSYSQKTQNILEDIVVQRIPEEWFHVIQKKENTGKEVEAISIYNSPHSTWYKADIADENILVIPQASDPSWIAIGKTNGKYRFVNNEYKIIINGWKQAWDISDLEFNTIYVIYWPNLLGYLGYILIVIEGIYLTVKLFKKKDGK